MRLSRAQILSDLRVWEARARLAEDNNRQLSLVLGDLRRRLREAQDGNPSLASQVRLAHELEQTEALLDAERREGALVRERLEVFAHRHPDLFEAYR